MKKNKTTAAVILAGGRGIRMGGNYKQLIKIKGIPVIFYSLREFIKCSFISHIVLVVPEEKFLYIQKMVHKTFNDGRIKLIVGGETRRHSSYLALRHLECLDEKIDFVIFHDAARPLVSDVMIKSVATEAGKTGAATIAVNAIDTVGFVKNGFLVSNLNKEKLCYVYLPNCFKFNWIWEAHHHKINKSKSFKDAENTTLLTNIGKKIKIIEGFYPNIKLTYEPDIRTVGAFLS